MAAAGPGKAFPGGRKAAERAVRKGPGAWNGDPDAGAAGIGRAGPPLARPGAYGAPRHPADPRARPPTRARD
ncbi:MAG: hypothetical protein ACJA1L_003568 [Paracoccaceae bacterium]|jgi:hypothetical protein